MSPHFNTQFKSAVLALLETAYIHTMMVHIISYRDRRGGEESASERVEFVARRADNGAKFGCVDPDRVGDRSEELELRVLCEYIVPSIRITLYSLCLTFMALGAPMELGALTMGVHSWERRGRKGGRERERDLTARLKGVPKV